jgi:hypothetical protein
MIRIGILDAPPQEGQVRVTCRRRQAGAGRIRDERAVVSRIDMATAARQ